MIDEPASIGNEPDQWCERVVPLEPSIQNLPVKGTIDEEMFSSTKPRTRRQMLKFLGLATGAAVGANLAQADPAAAANTGSVLLFSNPVRAYDSRLGGPSAKLKGSFVQVGAIGPAQAIGPFSPGGYGTIGLVGNLTTTEQEGSGFASIWPTGSSYSGISNINFVAGVDIANSFHSLFGTNNSINVGASAPTHFILDIFGVLV